MKVSIKNKLLIIILIAIIVLTAILLSLSINSINTISNKNIQNYKIEAYKAKEKELSNYVTIAIETIKTYYIRGNNEQSKQEAIEAIKNMRYGKNGYFWINDTHPTMIIHPIKPQLNGKDLSKYKDPNGIYLFNEMVKVCKTSSHSGLVKYSWSKPGKDKPQPKFSYVALFKPWNWIVGTGAYVDDIDEQVTIMQNKTNIKIRNTIISFIVIALLVMIAIILIVNIVISKMIINPLQIFQKGLLSFFKYLKTTDSNDIKILDINSQDEIGKMANSINENIKYATIILQKKKELENELKSLNANLEEKIKTTVKQNLAQERQIIESAKMAQLGEMIGNIAHQWRQPLNMISTVSTGTIARVTMDMLDEKILIEDMEKINKSTIYLSETIDTFRNFLKEKKVLKKQTIQENIKSAMSIVGTVLKDVGIEFKQDVNYEQPITVTIVSGELPQVIINIINNAKDEILRNKIKNGIISLSLKKENNKAIIIIEDNAGGIPENIMPKIFEPYFTTKEDDHGTGLGLHMSKRIITESLKGNLYAKNNEKGAVFYIEIPLEINKKEEK